MKKLLLALTLLSSVANASSLDQERKLAKDYLMRNCAFGFVIITTPVCLWLDVHETEEEKEEKESMTQK